MEEHWTDNFIKRMVDGSYMTFNEQGEEHMIAKTKEDAKRILEILSVQLDGRYKENEND